jgi:hypothetical protein
VYRLVVDVVKDAAQSASSQLMAVRCLANAFVHPLAKDALVPHHERVLESVADLAKSTNAPLRRAVATLLLKCVRNCSLFHFVETDVTMAVMRCGSFAVFFVDKPNPERKIQSVSIVAEVRRRSFLALVARREEAVLRMRACVFAVHCCSC